MTQLITPKESWDSEWNIWIRCWCSIKLPKYWTIKNTGIQMFEKRKSVSVRNWHKMDAYLYKQGRSIGKALTGIHQNELFESNPDRWKYPQPAACQKPDWCIIFRSSRICSWLLWTNMYFIPPSSWKKVPIYSRFVPGVYRPVLRPCDFCPNPAQTCLRYA